MRVAVVLAGGLGTRVAHLAGTGMPKALLPLDGRRFIDFKLTQLASLGVEHVVMLTGHGADALEEHVGDGRPFGLEVDWFRDGPQLVGTGGAIQRVIDELPQHFWVTFGDTLVEAPLSDIERSVAPPLVGCMTVLRNQDRWQPSNVDVADGLVTRYEKGLAPGTVAWIDYGLLYLERSSFTTTERAAPFDLGEVICDAVARRALAAYPVETPFHDIGTERDWRATDAWARSTQLWRRLTSDLERA